MAYTYPKTIKKLHEDVLINIMWHQWIQSSGNTLLLFLYGNGKMKRTTVYLCVHINHCSFANQSSNNRHMSLLCSFVKGTCTILKAKCIRLYVHNNIYQPYNFVDTFYNYLFTLFGIWIGTPLFTKYRATSAWPHLAAKCINVLPS